MAPDDPRPLLSLDDLAPASLSGVTALVRVDYNVPLEGGEVADDTRLRESLPTLAELRQRDARIVLVSHLGRPKGKAKPELSLRPVVRALTGLLGVEVGFADDCVGTAARHAVAGLAAGGVCLLENLRFHAGEEANDPAFADQLAALADVYVDDAFGTAHRAHASTVGVAERLARHAAGRLLVREVEQLSRLLQDPARPYVAILGGAKVSGKLEVLERLVETVDRLLLGGGMANTFLAAGGAKLAGSLVEHDQLATARRVEQRCRERGVELVLPEDLVASRSIDDPNGHELPGLEVPAEHLAVDIGTRTAARFAQELQDAGTVFWNGPLGVFERPPFDRGTVATARALADCPGFTVVGGGETVAAVQRAGVADRIGHVSTGGGASLELLAGRRLPGVEILRRPA